MMRLAAGRVGEGDLPSEAELEEYLERHREGLAEPARVRLTHVYFSEDARGGRAVTDALAVLGELRGTGAAAGAGRGDGFLRGAEFDGSRDELARAFGAGFAATVDAAPARTWFGPVRSAYGVHFVWLDERQPARTPSVAEVRGRLLHGWLRGRSDERRRAAMDAMRATYNIRIEEGSGVGG